jgi:putative SOS response-associated peptidase YedK
MCGRFTLATPRQVIEQSFGVDLSGVETAARYNIAPSQDVLAIAIGKSGERRGELMRWGLIPHWSKDGKVRGSTINARLESLETSPTFRDAFRKRRCLLPADGFYEWQVAAQSVAPAPRRRAPPKVPYWIAPCDGPLLALAGVYAVWRAKDGDPWLLSCAIVTAPANAALASIHERMPLILRPEDWSAWIARDSDPASLRRLLAPDPLARYRAHPVSLLVNDPDHDGPELIRAVEPAGTES